MQTFTTERLRNVALVGHNGAGKTSLGEALLFTSGDIIGDLNSRRGHILGIVPNGDGTTMVEAHAPQEAIQRYTLELRSMTQARGSFTVEPDHYQEVPPLLQKQIVEQAKPDHKAASQQ
jgi:translation elongation factor EF-G